MRFASIIASAVCLAVGLPQTARADIITATFEGTVVSTPAGTYAINGHLEFGFIPYSTLRNAPFVAVFSFDTTKGTLGTAADGLNSLGGGLLDASLTIEIAALPFTFTQSLSGVGSFFQDPNCFNSCIEWNNDLTFARAYAESFPFHVNLFESFNFQMGTCPGRPCGTLDVDTITVSYVPGPLAGAGIPGLVLALGGFLGWMRRKKAAMA